MDLLLTRKIRSNTSTIGELTVNGVFECYILEDKDRGLSSTMSLSEIASQKVPAKTCIPAGRYEVIVSFSNRFKKSLPLLLDVPGFAGIRIHTGNTSADTEGCLLPGATKSADFVGKSTVAFNALFSKITAGVKKGKVFITIK